MSGESHSVSIATAAEVLDMSIEDVYDLCKGGELASVQSEPGAQIDVLTADIPRYLAEAAS